MSRLSREKREQQGAGTGAGAGQPVLAAAPIDVLVGPGGASVGGVPVPVVRGEELQHTVLNHLHRIALATGHPVHATVHDDRIGYVVALRVDTNGSSHLTAEPVQTAPPGVPEGTGPGESGQGEPGQGVRDGVGSGDSGPASRDGAPAGAPDRASSPTPASTTFPPAPAEPTGPSAPSATAPEASAFPPAPSAFPAAPDSAEAIQDSAPPAFPTAPETAVPSAAAVPSEQPSRDKPTHLLRQTPEPPTFPLRAVPEPDGREPRDAVPTFRLRAVPEWVADAVPGTVAAPTGQFGPPPVMDTPVTDVPMADAPVTNAGPESEPRSAPEPKRTPEPRFASGPAPASGPALTPSPTRAPKSFLDPSAAPFDTPDPKPTPPRGFDAVAEAVLGDDPATAYDGGGAVGLAEPMGRINDAVKAGRVDAAAQIAEQTVVEASRTLGPEHPEVLRLLELTAYIAYLAGDPARAFGLSLDLARSRRHTRDAEAAYGNIQSAATAWRAVRDPEQGLRMGVELIGLWTELTMEDGPAVEEIEQLESARTRMGRLAERARKLNS